jgi:hypothetical protein
MTKIKTKWNKYSFYNIRIHTCISAGRGALATKFIPRVMFPVENVDPYKN